MDALKPITLRFLTITYRFVVQVCRGTNFENQSLHGENVDITSPF